MPYAFEPDEPLMQGVRRLADEKLDDIVGDLLVTGPERDEAIHSARKRFKKLRGLLRVIRPADEEFYTLQNARFRDAARSLAASREAAAAIEVLNHLCARYGRKLPSGDLPAVRTVLFEAHRHLAATESAPETDLARRACAEGGAAFAIFEFPAAPPPARVLAAGAGRVYRTGRNALKTVRRSATPEAFHELRKAVKYHWMHNQLLRRFLPDAKLRARRLKALADDLGHLHDIDMMRLRLADPAQLPAPAEERALLAGLLERERKRLARHSLAEARVLFDEKPARFARATETALSRHKLSLDPS